MSPTHRRLPSPATCRTFRRRIHRFFRAHGRSFPWRRTRDPYRVLVSEVMLQQTQTSRVETKFPEFLSRFPTITALSRASLREVIAAWSGLGYNRRAIALKALADLIVREHGGRLPRTREGLLALPGIGPYTAGAIMVFARNSPELLIETNIRAVFIHEFFRGRTTVHDSEILPLIESTMDRRHPREWYWGLMDYGVWLKARYRGIGRRSAHYVQATPFKGSRRELRGALLRAITPAPVTVAALARVIESPRGEIEACLVKLADEGFIHRRGSRWEIAG